MHDLAIGPSHADFALFPKGSRKNSIGRLIFDAKLANQVNVEIQLKELKISMQETLKFLRYNYSMALKNREFEMETEHSPDIPNPSFSESHDVKSTPKMMTGSKILVFPKDATYNPKLKTTVTPLDSPES